MKAKTVNYTDTQIATMQSMYTGNDNIAEVKAIADAINKNAASVRAKLSSLGVYVKAEAVKSTRDSSGTKAVKAQVIADATGMNELERDALVKTTQAVLDKLITRLTNSE